MRNEALTGYLLHHRSYQDKRSVYYLFTEHHGVVHGIGKRGLPLFEKLQVFASGKRSLKNFTQAQLVSATNPIRGHQQYAALYLNEILYQLLPAEDPLPQLWLHYQSSLNELRLPLNPEALRLCLRKFEHSLFTALGYEVLLTHDSEGQPIQTHRSYRYIPERGLEMLTDAIQPNPKSSVLTGQMVQQMQHEGICSATLVLWSALYRDLIDHLVDHQPLQSRLLWQQQRRYQ